MSFLCRALLSIFSKPLVSPFFGGASDLSLNGDPFLF